MVQVKLILSEDVPKLGHAGQVVTVKPGYARNYLVPQGLAILATEGRISELDHHSRLIEEKVQKDRTIQEAERSRIQDTVVEITAQVGVEGKLFGSVTSIQIAELLAQQGVEVDRRRIDLKSPIKEIGEHTVPIRLHRDVTAEVKVVVTAANAPPPAPDAEVADLDDVVAAREAEETARADAAEDDPPPSDD